jgi:hypothetical protein
MANGTPSRQHTKGWVKHLCGGGRYNGQLCLNQRIYEEKSIQTGRLKMTHKESGLPGESLAFILKPNETAGVLWAGQSCLVKV